MSYLDLRVVVKHDAGSVGLKRLDLDDIQVDAQGDLDLLNCPPRDCGMLKLQGSSSKAEMLESYLL